MRAFLLLLLGALLVLGATVGLMFFRAAPERSGTASPTTATPGAAARRVVAAPESGAELRSDPAPGSTAGSELDAAALAARLERMEQKVEVLTAELAEVRAQRGPTLRTPAGADPDPDTPPLDDETLAELMDQATERRSAERLESLSDEQLLSEGARLRREDPLVAQQMLEALLERRLTAKHRTEALTHLGLLHRRAGDMDAAERALEQASLTGGDTDEGAWATYEYALTLSDRGDHQRALALVQPVPETPGISEWNRLHAEWAIATLTERTGNVGEARAQYERLLAYLGDSDEFDWLVQKIQRQLKAL